MQHICKHKNFKKCAKQITNGIKKKPCKSKMMRTIDLQSLMQIYITGGSSSTRKYFSSVSSKYFSDMPGSAQGPKFQIRILGSSEKIWGFRRRIREPLPSSQIVGRGGRGEEGLPWKRRKIQYSLWPPPLSLMEMGVRS